MQNPSMHSIERAKTAGKLAFFLGVFWAIGLSALTWVQVYVWQKHMVLLLPIFGLLALYFLFGGLWQWRTGKGGIGLKEDISLVRSALVQAICLTLLFIIFRFA